MTKKELFSLFSDCYNNCAVGDKVAIHNYYLIESEDYDGEDEIHCNDEDFFSTFFSERPMEAIRATHFGNYEYSSDYVWFNAYGNLNSGSYDFELPFRDTDVYAEWYIENYDFIEHIDGMKEFSEACMVYEEDSEEEEDE